MPNELEWTHAVQKLVNLTELGEVHWSVNSSLAVKRENVHRDGFQALVDNHFIAVYEYRFRTFEDEDTWSWETDVAIEFVSIDGDPQWRWPATTNRWELLEAVRGSVVGANTFLRDFLAEGTSS